MDQTRLNFYKFSSKLNHNEFKLLYFRIIETFEAENYFSVKYCMKLLGEKIILDELSRIENKEPLYNIFDGWDEEKFDISNPEDLEYLLECVNKFRIKYHKLLNDLFLDKEYYESEYNIYYFKKEIDFANLIPEPNTFKFNFYLFDDLKLKNNEWIKELCQIEGGYEAINEFFNIYKDNEELKKYKLDHKNNVKVEFSSNLVKIVKLFNERKNNTFSLKKIFFKNKKKNLSIIKF